MNGDRLSPARPFLAASVAVFRDGEVLVASRGKAPWEGVFSLPGGQVEVGETLEQAALRELAEEVGVTATLTGLIAPFEVIEREADGRVKHHVVIAVLRCAVVVGRASDGAGSKGNPLDHGAGDRKPADDAGTGRHSRAGLRARPRARLKRVALGLLSLTLSGVAEPVLAQNFFERLFGPPRDAQPQPQSSAPAAAVPPRRRGDPQRHRRPQPKQSPQGEKAEAAPAGGAAARALRKGTVCGSPRSSDRSHSCVPCARPPTVRNGAAACRC